MDINFSRGKIVNIRVLKHVNFGVIVEVYGTPIKGIIESHELISPSDYPEVGTELTAVILDLRNSENPIKRKLYLTVNQSIVDNPKILLKSE